MFKAFNERTGEVRQFNYLLELAAERQNGWTAGEAIDKAADVVQRETEKRDAELKAKAAGAT